MTESVTLTINDRPVTVPKGTLVLDAAARLGIEIPIFCSHPQLDPVACCRQCLVEISGPRGMVLMTACSTPVADGMTVRTDTQQVQEVQEANLSSSSSTTRWIAPSATRAASARSRIRRCVSGRG